jgi:hypothetical protein
MASATVTSTCTHRARLALRRLERVARDRHGVFTRDHARTAGVSDSTLDRLRASGAIVRLHPRVYCFASAPRTDRLMWFAAVESGGSDACLGGDAALRMRGIRIHCWRRSPIEVVSVRRNRPRPQVRYVCTKGLDRDEWSLVERCRVLRLERILVERSARGESEAVLCALIDEAAFQGQLSKARMHRTLQRHAGRSGIGRLRRAFGLYLHGDGGAQSALEDRVGAPIVAAATGRVERNRLRSFGGNPMRPDIYLSDIGLVVEMDGFQGHSRPTRIRDDRARDKAYAREDITCMRIRELRVEEDTAAVLAEMHRRQGTGPMPL